MRCGRQKVAHGYIQTGRNVRRDDVDAVTRLIAMLIHAGTWKTTNRSDGKEWRRQTENKKKRQ